MPKKKEVPKKEVLLLSAPKTHPNTKKRDSLWDRLNSPLPAKTFWITNFIFIISGVIFSVIFFGISNFGTAVDTLKDYVPVTKQLTSLDLGIDTPDDNSLSNDKVITVSGQTSPLAVVIISVDSLNGDTNSVGTEAKNSGDFSKIVSLFPGLNKLSVVAFDSEGNSKSLEKLIYYSEEKLEQ